MARHRLWNTVLFCGFGTYVVLCVIIQTVFFMHYTALFQGMAHINFIPFAVLWEAWNGTAGPHMPLIMWLQLAGLMVPLGLCLFLWVEDCTDFGSIAAIAAGFSGIFCVTNYLLTAPVFDIDFITASLCGTFAGYSLAVIAVELLFTRRIQPLLNQPPRHFKKA